MTKYETANPTIQAHVTFLVGSNQADAYLAVEVMLSTSSFVKFPVGGKAALAFSGGINAPLAPKGIVGSSATLVQ